MNRLWKIIRRVLFAALVLYAPLAGGQTTHDKVDLVEIVKLDSTIRIDIRYATPNNFLGVAVYPVGKCYLRREVAERLVRAHRALRDRGLGLKIWDGYRPRSVQYKMWEKVPNPDYVADPKKGSRHNRGAAVDLTLVDHDGNELEMPTPYDDFSEKAHRSYEKISAAAKKHRQILEEALKKEGFIPMPTEWWHFDAAGWESYPLLDVPLEKLK